MLRFIVILFFFSVVTSELDIIGNNQWYPLRGFKEYSGRKKEECATFKFMKSDSTCKCNVKDNVPTLSVKVEGEPKASPPVPYFFLEDDAKLTDAMSILCDCPNHKGFFYHLVFKRLENDYFLAYFSIFGNGAGLLFGKERISEQDLDDLVKNIDLVKNEKTYVDICTTGNVPSGFRQGSQSTEASGNKTSWFSFIPTE